VPFLRKAKPSVEEDRGKKNNADQTIHHEEGLVDPREVLWPNHSVFPPQKDSCCNETNPEKGTKPFHPPDEGQQEGRRQMEKAGDPKRLCDPDPRRQGIEALSPVKVAILTAVDDVKPGHPKED
jgi:hypothetical protein